MSIRQLMRVVPPPDDPDEVGTSVEEKEVESKLGMPLPRDYWELVQKYGSGTFIGSFLRIANPFVDDLGKEAADKNGRVYSYYHNGELPWPPFPAQPGLLPVGVNENGNDLIYLTEGKPNRWPLLVKPHGSDKEYERWDLPLSTFLAQAMMNKILSVMVHPNLEDLVLLQDRNFTRVGDFDPARRRAWRKKHRAKKK